MIMLVIYWKLKTVENWRSNCGKSEVHPPSQFFEFFEFSVCVSAWYIIIEGADDGESIEDVDEDELINLNIWEDGWRRAVLPLNKKHAIIFIQMFSNVSSSGRLVICSC